MYLDLAAWSWPQWTYLGLYLAVLLIVAAQNGKPRAGTHNFALTFMVSLLYLALLGFGGFWS